MSDTPRTDALVGTFSVDGEKHRCVAEEDCQIIERELSAAEAKVDALMREKEELIGQCAVIAAIHSQYPITDEYDKGYDKARKDAAMAIRALVREQHTHKEGQRLVYNKVTRTIDKVRKDGLVVGSFDPPVEEDSSVVREQQNTTQEDLISTTDLNGGATNKQEVVRHDRP